MRHAGYFGLKKSVSPVKPIKKIHTVILYDCARNRHADCAQSFPTVTGGLTLCLCPCHDPKKGVR